MQTIPFLNSLHGGVITYVFLGIWQSVGWNTIIYRAFYRAGINPRLYKPPKWTVQAASGKSWLFVARYTHNHSDPAYLSLGRILGGEFDRPYALMNHMVNNVSNVIVSIFGQICATRSSDSRWQQRFGLIPIRGMRHIPFIANA